MKKTMILILAAIMLLTLTACQETPEEEFIVQKDTERMVEQAADDTAGTKVSRLKVPDDNYTFETTTADGALTINVDAPVAVPESEKIPTARVSEAGLTQEQVTVIFNYLFSGEQPVTGDNVPGVLTKDEIQEIILLYRQYIAEGTTDEYTMCSEEELEEEIKKLEKQYETAPETEPELDIQVSDGTMTKEITGGDKYNGEEVLRLDAGTEEKRIFVTSPLGENGGTENHFGFYVDDGNHASYTEMNALRVDEENWQTAAQGKLTMPYADAKALCDDFFAAVGMTDVALSDVFIIDDEAVYPREGQPAGPENYIYQLDYVRTVGGVPAANLSAVIGSGDDYSLPWLYERIMFRVNDNGIQDISWDGHTQTGEVINTDTGVIDFEEACEIFETMIVTTYQISEMPGPAVVKTSVSIDEIELSIMRVREQNASGRNGIYTPVWVFYGHVVREREDGRIEYDRGGRYASLKYPVLIINAVDGSIIDPLKGY